MMERPGQQDGQRGMMERPMADLKSLPPEQQIASMRYCDSVFHVTTAEGDTLDFPEFNLRLKVDGTDTGPPDGTPALLSAGMMGDRAFVIFADPAEISAFIENEC
jgi:cytochrome c